MKRDFEVLFVYIVVCVFLILILLNWIKKKIYKEFFVNETNPELIFLKNDTKNKMTVQEETLWKQLKKNFQDKYIGPVKLKEYMMTNSDIMKEWNFSSKNKYELRYYPQTSFDKKKFELPFKTLPDYSTLSSFLTTRELEECRKKNKEDIDEDEDEDEE